MNAALPMVSVERLDICATPPGRASAIAPQSGPSFADLLLRGQETRGAPAQAAKPPPEQTDAPPREDIECEQGDAAPAESAPEAPVEAGKTSAKPAPRAREKTPALASAAQPAPPLACADGKASEAAAPRPTTGDAGGDWPPGTLPIADLHEWMASLKPPEPMPRLPGCAAAQDRAAPSATADSVAGLRSARGRDALVAAAGGAALPRPADGAALPGPADGVALAKPAEDAALPEPVESVGLPNPADGAALPRLAEGVAAPKPAEGAALPRPAGDGSAPVAVDGAAVPDSADRAALQPAAAATNALPAQRKPTERDEPRHDGSDGVAATRGGRPAAPSQIAAALASGERRPAPPDMPAARDLVQGLLGGAAGAVPRGFDAATLAPIALPAALHSPEFAQVLGAQVSVLARDGVQHAELHLNPAEMGPISVHIRIDDTAARVDFHAGAAATREVIERGLPELASALREQGLTLAGGGVFQQPPDPRGHAEREAAGASGQPRRFVSMMGDTPARTIAIPVPQGRLDVYA